jgi:hypothetical protein
MEKDEQWRMVLLEPIQKSQPEQVFEERIKTSG